MSPKHISVYFGLVVRIFSSSVLSQRRFLVKHFAIFCFVFYFGKGENSYRFADDGIKKCVDDITIVMRCIKLCPENFPVEVFRKVLYRVQNLFLFNSLFSTYSTCAYWLFFRSTSYIMYLLDILWKKFQVHRYRSLYLENTDA